MDSDTQRKSKRLNSEQQQERNQDFEAMGVLSESNAGKTQSFFRAHYMLDCPILRTCQHFCVIIDSEEYVDPLLYNPSFCR